MNWLNYHHLFYFWTTARLGSVTKASQELRLAQPTISAQLKALEDNLGAKLFERAGRGLVLSESGKLVYDYAQKIFGLGQELLEVVEGRSPVKGAVLRVGVADVVPKVLAFRLLEPLLRQRGGLRISCAEDHADRLLAALAVHDLDLVISDAPVPPSLNVKAYNHLLGTSRVSFFATKLLKRELKGAFPRLLQQAPLLLPMAGSSLRSELELWFAQSGIVPCVVGEFQDSALMKTFGRAGSAVFPAPSAIRREICSEFGVMALGEAREVRLSFYLISVERKLKHPALVSILEQAKKGIF
jgi:LysR family transcriptional activator of nhaA